MHPLLRALCGGDRRSIGASNRVVARLRAQPQLTGILVRGIESADAVLRMRCADALEKLTAERPELLVRHKRKLLNMLWKIEQQEVRWHVAPMLARLPLSTREERMVLGILLAYTNDRSSIVKTMAMQAMADLALRSPRHRLEVRRHLEELTVAGTPAMRARGRKLLARWARITAARRP